jgi:hypothetical protein
MNFSSSSNYFHIKYSFLIHLFNLNKLWTGHQNPRTTGSNSSNNQDSVNTTPGRRVIYEKVHWLFTNIATAKGYGCFSTVGLETERLD